MRAKLVTELVREVLGPRTDDIREIIDVNPASEFITGVLAPIEGQLQDLDDELDIPLETNETETEEETGTDADINVLPIFQPALDPKNKPSTMGISFVIHCDESPLIDVCLTWARYRGLLNEKGRVNKWQRVPKTLIMSIDFKNQPVWIDSNGNIGTQAGAELSFHAIANPLQNGNYFIHLYVVNRLPKSNGPENISDQCIFQPEIRVCVGDNCKIVPDILKAPRSEEEQKMQLLYQERSILARGHLCSAIWKDIDSQIAQDSFNKLDFPECRKQPPFHWIDGCLLDEKNMAVNRTKFSSPDIRTDFVPVYAIAHPKLEWPINFNKCPELKASKLAETYSPIEVQEAFSPITEEFAEWISRLQTQTSTLSDKERIIANQLVTECRTVLSRIQAGIDLLCKDDEVRLAFCFANQAIQIQASWSNNPDYKWRPFQMSFILMSLESMVNPTSEFRNTCDLLWVPTGTGKTEAYLALIAFMLAYRRRKALARTDIDRTGCGVSVITRYTLRLLTIQQFRRTLALITACEFLRVWNLQYKGKKLVGWRPSQSSLIGTFIFGSSPFSCGLWVGGAVSPNRLETKWPRDSDGRKKPLFGAIDILRGERGEGEPAQVLTCPACGHILAVPDMGLPIGDHEINLVVKQVTGDLQKGLTVLEQYKTNSVTFSGVPVFTPLEAQGYYALTLNLHLKNILTASDIDNLWETLQQTMSKEGLTLELCPVRASRMGYFIRNYNKQRKYDFEVYCSNPKCDLTKVWCGGLPSGWITDNSAHNLGPNPDGWRIPIFSDGNRLIDVPKPFRKNGTIHLSDRIPIPALTVEDQVFQRLPSVVVATADKFARPPFNPEAGSLFGNVDAHHCIHGYYRKTSDPPKPTGTQNKKLYIELPRPPAGPDLIIQDELHLIEGPLGSLVGLYETAIDFLCKEATGYPVKYIASTATIKRALDQTKALFSRKMQIFPPQGLDVNDRFFIRDTETHALDEGSAGRLYVGICAPGRGPLTPLVRIYSRLLHTVEQNKSNSSVDNFWTLTGYFNAIRELGGARALYRQDIPQRIQNIVKQEHGSFRELDDNNAIELSSRRNATDLPAILDLLKKPFPDASDALFTTSMFGTGVDIPRVGLMVVNGQPKTTSAYIQASGRVGRRTGALVVTFLRASRPRDLNHYEFFAGYHRQLHRYVEPATVYPFSPGTLDRALGPVMVFILRNMRHSTTPWRKDDSASQMATQMTEALKILVSIFENRSQAQPSIRKPLMGRTSKNVQSKLDIWQSIAKLNPSLKYVEYAINKPPESAVVLGDYQHLHAHKEVVYENAPQSLRDIEETTGFQTKDGI
ncbi:MAG: DISARM system helicase DrmA [Nitrososphaerota archaeon]|jgi:hypothetical protein|nr:DISARM system helicase DrmA [Nitrososphaerota archaeon]